MTLLFIGGGLLLIGIGAVSSLWFVNLGDDVRSDLRIYVFADIYGGMALFSFGVGWLLLLNGLQFTITPFAIVETLVLTMFSELAVLIAGFLLG